MNARRAALVLLVIAMAWLAAKMTRAPKGDWAPPRAPAEPGRP